MANDRIKNRVKNKSKASANIPTMMNIKNLDLVDYIHNHEDVTDTLDLENSMKELGFTDPLEVTSFGVEEGKYMILSGHRRRTAGVKVGFDVFPCMVKHFESESEVMNYVQLSNSQRDSAKDPLLFAKRYKLHETYLNEIKFDGSYRDEIAKRLGISVAQADRYKNFNKIIEPVWDMVREEKTGMSNVIMMYKHSVEEQAEILSILNDAIDNGEDLTRKFCEMVIKAYREGKKTYLDIVQIDISEVESDIKTNHNSVNVAYGINTEPSETKDDSERNRNDEIRREYDPDNPLNEKDPYKEERLTEEDYATIEAVSNSNEKKELTEEEKALKMGKDLHKLVDKMSVCLENIYSFQDGEEAKAFIDNMGMLFSNAVDGMYVVAQNHNLVDDFKNLINSMSSTMSRDYK